ncbi:MAG: nitroreductase family protein [Terriglobia bacterium]
MALDVYEAIHGRRSVRAFERDRPVPSGTVERLLEAAVRAPSAGNVQPWRFWVVRDTDLIARLAEAANGQMFVGGAPVVFVVAADLAASDRSYGRRGVNLYSIQDTAAAVQNLLLAVYAEGLGGCWVGAFSESEVSGCLGLIPVGFPARDTRPARKHSIQDVTQFR